MEKKYKEIADVIISNKHFLICSHAHPDGDGIGSTLALGLALEKMGKDVVMYNEDRVPRNLDFLPGASRMRNTLDASEVFDVTIMVDCGQPERVGEAFPPPHARGKLICIDHHRTGCDEALISCYDEGAASTGEVVYNILKQIGMGDDADTAKLILTTLIVDTGFFRYSNTTAHALALASELVSKGASTWDVSRNMEERVNPKQLKLLSSALDTIEYLLDGKMAMMVLTQQMFKAADADIEMAEEFINFPRSIDGVEVAVLIREKEGDVYKISFRSKDSVDVAALAGRFGGGGHEHAAGCTINGRLGVVKQIVTEAVRQVIKEKIMNNE